MESIQSRVKTIFFKLLCLTLLTMDVFFFFGQDDDRAYKDLIRRLTQQIFHINGNINSIEKLVNMLGGPLDTTEVRGNL